MIVQHSVRFFLHIRTSGTTKPVPLRMRVTLKGNKPFDIPTGTSLSPLDFNATTQTVLGKSKECKEAQRTINEYSSMMDDIFARYEIIEKRIPEVEELKALVLDTLGRLSVADLTSHKVEETWNEYFREVGTLHSWSDGTLRKQKVIAKHFAEVVKVKDVRYINEKHIQQFVTYLTNHGYHNTTTNKAFRIVKQWLMWCEKKNYIDLSFMKDVSVRLKDSKGANNEIVYLTLEELHRVEDLTMRSPILEHVKDVFVFCCYSGLRFSDAYSLKREDIVSGNLITITQKTNDRLTIETNRHSQAILDKYSRVKYPGGRALPMYSNQKTNEALKEIGLAAKLTRKVHKVHHQGADRHDELIELWRLLTTHCARRTFVVTALTLGIHAEVIMRWTGHKNYEAMKPYIAIVDDLKKKEMQKFNEI